MIVLRDIPAIAELERLCWGKGAWLTEDEIAERGDKVALSLFGVTNGDTYGPGMGPPRTDAQWAVSDKRPANWEDDFWTVHVDAVLYPEEIIDWWAGDDEEADDIRFDVTDDQGRLLRCLKFIARPLICVVQDLMPEAVFTPDGSGGKAQEAAAWGSALEAEAERFKARRR